MSRVRPPIALALAVLLLAGCVERYRLRPVTEAEATTLWAAGAPLLARLGYVGTGVRCKVAAVLNDVDARDLDILPSSSPEHCLVVYATRGVLDVPRDELQALFAHGLAHLHLGHQTTTGRRVTTGVGSGSVAEADQSHLYSAAEEAEADRYAAQLLTRLGPGPTCQGLGDVLELIAAEAGRWEEWTTQHPLSPTRAAAARGFCESAR